jgi:hypothetical protein
MTQTACSTSFAAKSFDKLAALHVLRSNHLHGDRTLCADVRREIHRTQAAATKLAFDQVFFVKRLPYEIGKIHKIRAISAINVYDR